MDPLVVDTLLVRAVVLGLDTAIRDREPRPTGTLVPREGLLPGISPLPLAGALPGIAAAPTLTCINLPGALIAYALVGPTKALLLTLNRRSPS